MSRQQKWEESGGEHSTWEADGRRNSAHIRDLSRSLELGFEKDHCGERATLSREIPPPKLSFTFNQGGRVLLSNAMRSKWEGEPVPVP
jgi:hypothetical protein